MNLIHRTNAEPYNIHYGENELLSLKLKLVGTIYNVFLVGPTKKISYLIYWEDSTATVLCMYNITPPAYIKFVR